MTAAAAKELLTTDEVAKQLRTDAYSVREWIRAGALRAAKVGRRYLVTQEDVDAFVEARATTTRAAAEKRARHLHRVA